MCKALNAPTNWMIDARVHIIIIIICSCAVGKFLLMLQALKRASALDPDHPELHTHTLDFLLAG